MPTPSGKIEIFSKQLFDLGQPDEIPAVPKYIQEWESPFGPEARSIPLQAVGHHTLSRVHSTHDNNRLARGGLPAARLHQSRSTRRPAASGTATGSSVFNDRGAIVLPCRITDRIMPGVVAVPQGAWWDAGRRTASTGGGNINVLTSERWTPFAFGNAQHTIMVQAEKAKRRETMTVPDQFAFHLRLGSCSGCKTCQMACKDKNNLGPGTLWRRVYEISGGGWRNEGGLWVPDVAAYNLSMACQHCEDPRLPRRLPDAGHRQPRRRDRHPGSTGSASAVATANGPAPTALRSSTPRRGIMTKCDLCRDLVDAGGRPACVTSCPMRALDFGPLEELRAKYGGTDSVFPLPVASTTRPSLLIRPHRSAARAGEGRTGVANAEET